MNKVCSGIVLALSLFFVSSPAFASVNPIQVDGVALASDVKPENKNNRIMVPLRLVSENLGATVEWTNSEVTLVKNKMKVNLQPNSTAASINGKKIKLDVKPYIKDNHVFVPLRFIAETYDCKVSYRNSTVSVDTAPLAIDGIAVEALQPEYEMMMGSIIYQVKGNAYIEAVFGLFEQNKGMKIEAPANYDVNLDKPGSYSKLEQYDFMDKKGNSLKRFDVYSLSDSFPAESLSEYPKIILRDYSEDQWYDFGPTAAESIDRLIATASNNGFMTTISNMTP